MDFCNQRIVRSRDLQQVFQFSLKFQIFLPQDGDLALDQRDGAASDVRQPQRAKQRTVLFKKIRVVPEIIVNCILRQFLLNKFRLSLRAHMLSIPLIAISCISVTVGPVSCAA